MRLRILSSAFKDLQLGKQFYDSQEEGIGEYFLDSLFSDVDSLKLYAGIHRMVEGYFRMMSKRFPYFIYYKLNEDNEVVVFRILDSRRDPKTIKKELGANTTVGNNSYSLRE
jgi:plasmid stabilization system protein ParE